MGITCSSADRYVHCRQSTTIIQRTCSSPIVVQDIADVYNKNRQHVPQESTGICLSGVVYHHHKYHGLDITLMQQRVVILTITTKPYQEGSAASQAVLCSPTILWGDFELKKQVPGRLTSQLPSRETVVYGILSKHSKMSAEVTLKGILAGREVRVRASISSNDIASKEEVIRLHSDLKQWKMDETMEKEPFMIKDNIESPKAEKKIDNEIVVTKEEIMMHDEIRSITKSPNKKTDEIHLTKHTYVLHDGIGNQVVNHQAMSSFKPLSKSLEDLSRRQIKKLPLKRFSYSGIAFTNQLSSFSMVSSTHTVSSEMMNGGHLFMRNELHSFKLGGPVNSKKKKRRDTPITSYLKTPKRRNRSSSFDIAQDDGFIEEETQYITDCCMNMGGGASNVFDIFREKLCNSRRSSNQSAKLLEAMSARTSGDRPGTRRLSLGGAEQHIKSLSMCHIEVQRSFHCRSSEDISTHQFRAQCNCSSPNGLMEMRRIGTSTDLSQYNRNTTNEYQKSDTMPSVD